MNNLRTVDLVPKCGLGLGSESPGEDSEEKCTHRAERLDALNTRVDLAQVQVNGRDKSGRQDLGWNPFLPTRSLTMVFQNPTELTLMSRGNGFNTQVLPTNSGYIYLDYVVTIPRRYATTC